MPREKPSHQPRAVNAVRAVVGIDLAEDRLVRAGLELGQIASLSRASSVSTRSPSCVSTNGSCRISGSHSSGVAGCGADRERGQKTVHAVEQQILIAAVSAQELVELFQILVAR